MFLFNIALVITRAEYYHAGKDYTLFSEAKTFNDAIRFCQNRNQRLVQIENQAENEFIWEDIVEWGDAIWLGANNVVGTKVYIWLDGSNLTYSNWFEDQPNANVRNRNAIFMSNSHRGKWFDYSMSDTTHVLCESIDTSDHLHASIQPPYSTTTFNSNAESLVRNELLSLISVEKQLNTVQQDKLISFEQWLREQTSKVGSIETTLRRSQRQIGADIDSKLESLKQALTNEILSIVNVKRQSVEGRLGELLTQFQEGCESQRSEFLQLGNEVKAIKHHFQPGEPVTDYSYLNKEYFLTNESMTFDEALALCKDQGLTLVQIASNDENEFIFNKIVKPLGIPIWLDATIKEDTDSFEWLDGSEVAVDRFLRLLLPDEFRPRLDHTHRALMNPLFSAWFTETPTYNASVLCQKTVTTAIQSNFTVTINQLEERSKSRSGSQMTFNRNLERQANSIASELAMHKRQSDELFIKHETRLKRVENYIFP